MELYGTEKNLDYVAYLSSAYLTVSWFIIALALVNNISEIQKNLRQRYLSCQTPGISLIAGTNDTRKAKKIFLFLYIATGLGFSNKTAVVWSKIAQETWDQISFSLYFMFSYRWERALLTK